VNIQTLLQPLIDATRLPTPSLLAQLKVGQILPARVLTQIQPGLVRLQLASTVLLAKSQVALSPGTRLTVEVTKPMPLPELRILRPPSPAEFRQQVVRTALPRQLAPAEVRAELPRLADLPSTPRLRELLSEFVGIQRSQGLETPRPTPQAVQRAVAESGLTHEARLLAGAAQAVPGDAKLRLLHLLVDLKGLLRDAERGERAPLQPDNAAQGQRAVGDSLLLRLLRLVEGSLSRVQLQQAASLPQDDPQRQTWQLDLPLHIGQRSWDAQLRIEREPGRDPERGDESTWAVKLSFHFDTTGELQCRIALTGDRLATTFWSEHPSTHAQVERRLPALREAFEAQGFEVVKLTGVLGHPPEPLIPPVSSRSLLDERA
jgi:hypothetical protein